MGEVRWEINWDKGIVGGRKEAGGLSWADSGLQASAALMKLPSKGRRQGWSESRTNHDMGATALGQKKKELCTIHPPIHATSHPPTHPPTS